MPFIKVDMPNPEPVKPEDWGKNINQIQKSVIRVGKSAKLRHNKDTGPPGPYFDIPEGIQIVFAGCLYISKYGTNIDKGTRSNYIKISVSPNDDSWLYLEYVPWDDTIEWNPVLGEYINSKGESFLVDELGAMKEGNLLESQSSSAYYLRLQAMYLDQPVKTDSDIVCKSLTQDFKIISSRSDTAKKTIYADLFAFFGRARGYKKVDGYIIISGVKYLLSCVYWGGTVGDFNFTFQCHTGNSTWDTISIKENSETKIDSWVHL